MSAAFRMIEPGSAIDLDPDLLPIADRALLRLLAPPRCSSRPQSPDSSCTQTSAAPRSTCSACIAQACSSEHPLSRQTPGRAELAYRLSPLGHQRLGTRRATAPASYLRHSIDTARAICALNRASDREHAARPALAPRLDDRRTSSAGSSDPTASPSSRPTQGRPSWRSRSTKGPSTGERSAPSSRPTGARCHADRPGI